MSKWIFATVFAAALHGAVIRGTLVENQSGRALARALVALEPVAGTAGKPRSVRTGVYGSFQFLQVPAGSYLLTASRTGFAPFQYGQRQWKSSGTPLVVGDDDAPMLTIRLPRFGAITGTVLDENDVGLPEYEVVAYRNTRPPQIATQATSDERGVYRLYGLEPGRYLIRTKAKQYDEGAYRPTFAKETEIVEQAYSLDVDLDQQVDRVDIRPLPGRLFNLTVEVLAIQQNPPIPMPVTITLASDVGRETVLASQHRFESLPPGQYELFSQAPAGGHLGMQGDYRMISIGQDTTLRIVLHQVPELQFSFPGGPTEVTGQSPLEVLARRKDLAGEGPSETLKLVRNRVQLAAGPWELAVPGTTGYFVSGFSGPQSQAPEDHRFDGWNLITAGSGTLVTFGMSPNPGGVRGSVKSEGAPVSGVPVFLENYDLEPRRRITDPFVTRTDQHGQFTFTGLAPGNYRVLSSFEYRMPDSQSMSTAGARSVNVDAGHDVVIDLDLYGARQ